jgi:predicted MFS family arabinose efflux permease
VDHSFTALFILAKMFSNYGYLAVYLEKITRMEGKTISIILLLFRGTGIIGNWLKSMALTKRAMITTRFFILALIIAHLLTYLFGQNLIPTNIIITLCADNGAWSIVRGAHHIFSMVREGDR